MSHRPVAEQQPAPSAAPEPARRRQRGFTLVESLLVCTLVGILATLTLVASQRWELRAGRLDGVDALMRIQTAQEQHRALHGMYTADLTALRSAAAQSRQGRYSLQLQRTAGESYTAVATAQGRQSKDSPCPALTLQVDQGYPQVGPDTRCWNR
jgi:type IV pilus assembly protein PilE